MSVWPSVKRRNVDTGTANERISLPPASRVSCPRARDVGPLASRVAFSPGEVTSALYEYNYFGRQCSQSGRQHTCRHRLKNMYIYMQCEARD